MGASMFFTAAHTMIHAFSHGSLCVWKELENHIDVCRVTHGAHIEHLWLSKKTISVFVWL
jgi:hypothetical protein